MPSTHRQRIFRIASKALAEGQFDYTVVRDTVEQPLQPPDAEVCFAFSDTSLETVQEEVKRYLQRLGPNVAVTDHRNFGTV